MAGSGMSFELPSTDLDNHHIEGYARAAIEAGKDGHFKVPLISKIEDTLWTGGCIDGVKLPDDFHLVISLYPWEKYQLGPDTERVEVKLFDSADIPDETQLHDLADLVNSKRADGHRVLVHCQAGLNRSGLVAALSLIEAGYEPADAIALLREKRCSVVLCNEHFERWLLAQGEGPARG